MCVCVCISDCMISLNLSGCIHGRIHGTCPEGSNVTVEIFEAIRSGPQKPCQLATCATALM